MLIAKVLGKGRAWFLKMLKNGYRFLFSLESLKKKTRKSEKLVTVLHNVKFNLQTLRKLEHNYSEQSFKLL